MSEVSSNPVSFRPGPGVAEKLAALMAERNENARETLDAAVELLYQRHHPTRCLIWVHGRPGDINFHEDACDSCGQDLQPLDVWVGIFEDGEVTQPVCGGCATSE